MKTAPPIDPYDSAEPTDRELRRRAREDSIPTLPPPPMPEQWAPPHARERSAGAGRAEG